MLTCSQKKYLFAIYYLSQNKLTVRLSELSSFLGVSKASSVKMTAKLTQNGYIIKEPYREIILTEKGIKAANELFTQYIIIHDFLFSVIGSDEIKAETDAVGVISALSKETIDKLIHYILNNKKTERQ